MKLINTDGMAFIRPGSEWFWTALSGIVLAVTFIAIYRQLRAQGAANALRRLEALDDRWNSRLLALARLRSALSLRYGERQPGMSREMWQIMSFFVDVANLLENGHISLEEVDANWGPASRSGRRSCASRCGRSARAKATQPSLEEWNPSRPDSGGDWSHEVVSPFSGIYSSDRGDIVVSWYKGTGGYAGLAYFEQYAGQGPWAIQGQIFPGDPPNP